MPESKLPNMKKYNAIVGNKIFEFKSVKLTNIKNIANAIYKASKRDENVYIQVPEEVSLHELLVKVRGKNIIGDVWIVKEECITYRGFKIKAPPVKVAWCGPRSLSVLVIITHNLYIV